VEDACFLVIIMKLLSLTGFLFASSTLLLSSATVGCASEATVDDESSAAAVSSTTSFSAIEDAQLGDLSLLTGVWPVESSQGLVVNVVEETIDPDGRNRMRLTLVVNGVAYPLGGMVRRIVDVVETKPGELTMRGFAARADGTVERATVVFTFDVAKGALVGAPKMSGLGETRTLQAAAGAEGRAYARLVDVDSVVEKSLQVRVVTALAANAPDGSNYPEAWKRERKIFLALDEVVFDGSDPASLSPGRVYDLSALLSEVDAVKITYAGSVVIEGQEHVAATPGSASILKKPVVVGIDLRRAPDGSFASVVSATRRP